ncbi:uncharacterized protein LOC117324309 isoform X2 [Pecten maximus]|uniref:uncharacterized protein LOC117324309 isoform X2 n=1 Tax=Pecten maximus TaxID=6579 RepID=UPI0014584FE9|nr:uncharacterized protein LOC117324309 isoform X2 [Pecten maximus]
MDSCPLTPLSVDCSVEYELDMSRFPGWNDPQTRAQPSLMLHLTESCCCQAFQQISCDDDECDGSLVDDLSCNEIFDDVPQFPVRTPTHTLEEVLSSGRTLTDVMCDPFIIGAMSPSPLSPLRISSPVSSLPLPDIDFLLLSPCDVLQHPISRQKRKHELDDYACPSTVKRHCNYGDELFSELYMTFNRAEAKVNDPSTPNPDDDIGYEFIAPVRD